jgi:hypothetical protein
VGGQLDATQACVVALEVRVAVVERRLGNPP